MGKMVMALKKLGKKLTGKTINNDNTVGVINEIADEYEAPDLTPYATKVYVDGLMSGALKRLIVQALPTEDIDTNTIYMVLDESASQQGNVYNEYLYINNAWELIGTTAVAETVIVNGPVPIDAATLRTLAVGGVGYVLPQGVEYVILDNTTGTLSDEDLGKLNHGAYIVFDGKVLLPSGGEIPEIEIVNPKDKPYTHYYSSVIHDNKYYLLDYTDGITGVSVTYTITEETIGGEQNVSPYVLSYFDMVELAQGKVINVTQLIELLETKFDNFDNIEVGSDSVYLLASIGYAGRDGSKNLDLLHIETDSDDDAEIVLNGEHLISETTTKNLKQILLLNKTAIESVVLLSSLYNIDLDTISVVSCAVGGSNIKPYTYSEFKSLFKEANV